LCFLSESVTQSSIVMCDVPGYTQFGALYKTVSCTVIFKCTNAYLNEGFIREQNGICFDNFATRRFEKLLC